VTGADEAELGRLAPSGGRTDSDVAIFTPAEAAACFPEIGVILPHRRETDQFWIPVDLAQYRAKRRALTGVGRLLEWEAQYCDFIKAKFPAGQDGLSRKNNGTEV
jgi:hypothetical protein